MGWLERGGAAGWSEGFTLNDTYLALHSNLQNKHMGVLVLREHLANIWAANDS